MDLFFGLGLVSGVCSLVFGFTVWMIGFGCEVGMRF